MNLFNNLGGLPFWNERQIQLREMAITRLTFELKSALSSINSAWQFFRMEGPTLTPMEHVNPNYGPDDLFMLQATMAGQDVAMRAETTASSYAYAKHLMHIKNRMPHLMHIKNRMPLCVWQAGKSYRRELNGGARASTLRFNEFWQCEYQCIYLPSTKADYFTLALNAVTREIGKIVGSESRNVPSDHLPSYSLQTIDVEVPWQNEWKEMASVSLRNDFEGASVLEVAVGLDRLVMAMEQ